MNSQPRIIDLAPRRISTVVLTVFAGLAIIAALEALYFLMPVFAARSTDGRVAAFDLDGEGSLAVWFSTMLLVGAAAGALLVYFVRRQRPDDYHGKYRLWLWAAGCWLVMSLDETASLHEGFKEMMSNVTGHRLLGDGSIWWMTGYTLALGIIGVRLLLEMRKHWPSATLLVLSGVSLAVAAVAQLGWILPESGARGVMLEEGCEMAGFLFLATTMFVQARHVVHGGSTEAKAAKPKRTKSSSEEASGDAKPSKPAAKTATAETKKTVAPASITNSGNKVRIDEPQRGLPDRHKMTKAERKAMRRLEQEEREDRD